MSEWRRARALFAQRAGCVCRSEADQAGQQQSEPEAEREDEAVGCDRTLRVLLERVDTDSFFAYGVS